MNFISEKKLKNKYIKINILLFIFSFFSSIFLSYLMLEQTDSVYKILNYEIHQPSISNIKIMIFLLIFQSILFYFISNIIKKEEKKTSFVYSKCYNVLVAGEKLMKYTNNYEEYFLKNDKIHNAKDFAVKINDSFKYFIEGKEYSKKEFEKIKSQHLTKNT